MDYYKKAGAAMLLLNDVGYIISATTYGLGDELRYTVERVEAPPMNEWEVGTIDEWGVLFDGINGLIANIPA